MVAIMERLRPRTGKTARMASPASAGQREGGEGAFRRMRARSAAFATRRRVRFYDKMGRFTRDGMSLKPALQALQRRYARNGDVRARLFLGMVNRIEEGDHISQVLAPYIPPGERLLIQAGEESGRIHEGFFEAKNLAEVAGRLRAALFAELTYPVLLLAVLALMLVLIALFLVPILTEAVSIEKWPPFARGLQTLSTAVLKLGPFALAGLALGIFLAVRSLPGWTGPVRANLDRWAPPWTIYRELQGSSFLIGLAAMTAAGQSVGAAIERLAIHGSPWLKAHLKRMLRTIMTGRNPGEAMRTGLFDQEIEDDIEDYSRTANFEDALASVGKDQVEDTIKRIKQRAALIRYFVLFLVVAVLLYVYTSAVMIGLSVGQEGMRMMGK